MQKPNHLKEGDTVVLVSPSAPAAARFGFRVENGIKQLRRLGLEVEVSKHAYDHTGNTAGTPEQRASDINDAFSDSNVSAIISIIGGNNSNQLWSHLDQSLIKRHPKILLGYSDTTSLHMFLYKLGLVSFYGPAAMTDFAEYPAMNPYTVNYLKRALFSSKPIGKVEQSKEWTDQHLDWADLKNRKKAKTYKKTKGFNWLSEGRATAPIVGGCIESFEAAINGGKYMPNLSGKIFFWESCEKPHIPMADLDAFFTNLKDNGAFDGMKGMVISRLYVREQEEEKDMHEIIRKIFSEYEIPIISDVDAGHAIPKITIPLGVQVTLDSSKNRFSIDEAGVA